MLSRCSWLVAAILTFRASLNARCRVARSSVNPKACCWGTIRQAFTEA